jgi:8-oxo-dGTP pyrophosphatase MutT (NUDIX family)
MRMHANTATILQEGGVLPCHASDEALWIMLIRSTLDDIWDVPKGILKSGQNHAECAATEALDQAGLVGALQPDPFGVFYYAEFGRNFEVTMFIQDVESVYDHWENEDLFFRRWCTIEEAVEKLVHPDLCEMVARIPSVYYDE